MDLTPISTIVLQSIAAIARKHNTHYPYASQVKISHLLQEKHGVLRSARTVRRAIAELGEKGYIEFWQGKKLVKGLGEIYLANTYCLKPKAYALLGRAWTRLKWILKKPRRPFLAPHTSFQSNTEHQRPPSHHRRPKKRPLQDGILAIKTMPERKSEEETKKILLEQARMIKEGLVTL